MEIEKQVFTLFADFLKDLGKTYPEIKNCLYRNYEDVLTDNENKKIEDLPKLRLFLDCIYENASLIKDKNDSFFELDIELLEDISFKNLWSKNISSKTKDTIWKYLQTFSLITINLRSSEELQNALNAIRDDEFSKDDIKDKKVAKELQNLKELSSEVQKKVDEEEEFNLEDMMGGLMDSGIGGIAKEVAGSMDLESMMGGMDENSNPMELMAKLMDPEKMGSIFKNIDSIMKQKMESGELTEESLKGEAEGMVSKMSDNPLFGNLMQQMNQSGPNQSGPNQSGPNQSESKKEDKSSDSTDSTQESKAKLRQKIREKKKERTNQ